MTTMDWRPTNGYWPLPLQGLLPGFAGDAHGSHRAGFKALFADLAAAEVAVTIGAGVDPVQGFPDLADQSPFPGPADPQGEVPIRLQGGPVRRVREGSGNAGDVNPRSRWILLGISSRRSCKRLRKNSSRSGSITQLRPAQNNLGGGRHG